MTNLYSLSAAQDQRNATRNLQDSFRKLSSGFRIERAADDAAGLAVSENLSSQAMSQRVATRNANDGISIIQTMEGGVKEGSSLLKRMRELAVQSSSETLASTERAYLNDEFKQLQSEIGRIRETTAFNGTNLLNGSWNSGKEVQVGAFNTSNARISIVVGDVSQTESTVATASFTTGKVGVPGGGVSGNFSVGAVGSVKGGTALVYNSSNVVSDGITQGFTGATSALSRATAINTGTGTHGVTAVANAATYTGGSNVTAGSFDKADRFYFAGGNPTGSKHIYLKGVTVLNNDSDGALQKHLQGELDLEYGSGTYSVDTSSGKLSISAEDGRTFRFNLTDSGGLAGATAGSWQYGSGTLTLSSASDFEYKATSPADWGVGSGTNVVTASGGSSSVDLTDNAALNVSSVAGAQAAFTMLDEGLDTMNSHRSKLGAVQNRLESAINNLGTHTENLLAARSRIRDADFAFETAQLSKAQIMQSASTSVLAQGNQLPQMALRLIG